MITKVSFMSVIHINVIESNQSKYRLQISVTHINVRYNNLS